MPGRTQRALYSGIDLELSWSEDELPQVERTKHVHSLHPYLGKFIPQLVEVFLNRYFSPGDCIYDPFVGSGTTLVEANVFGADAMGCDISAFNCLLSRVKTARYPLRELALLAYRAPAEQLASPYDDVARVILSRAARSARLTTHFDLDFPRAPVTSPYWCLKHKRECRPVEEAWKFLVRYTTDTVRRLREFAALRIDRDVTVLHADSRSVRLPVSPTGVITSPPYPGLIDYHEQHRYAYELLGLVDRRDEEIGAASSGRSRSARRAYVDAMSAVFDNTASQLARDAWVLIVVNDSQSLYPDILQNASLVQE